LCKGSHTSSVSRPPPTVLGFNVTLLQLLIYSPPHPLSTDHSVTNHSRIDPFADYRLTPTSTIAVGLSASSDSPRIRQYTNAHQPIHQATQALNTRNKSVILSSSSDLPTHLSLTHLLDTLAYSLSPTHFLFDTQPLHSLGRTPKEDGGCRGCRDSAHRMQMKKHRFCRHDDIFFF